MKESLATYLSRRRLRPWHLALCVLLVGWVPSLLLAYYSYRVLGHTLEGKIMADAQSLVGSLSQHVENELDRIGETLDYYRTLPTTANLLTAPLTADVRTPPRPPVASTPPDAHHPRTTTLAPPAPVASAANGVAPIAAGASQAAQDWLAGVFYPQVNRIDGMFLTDTTGRIIASVPPSQHESDGRDVDPLPWRGAAERAAGVPDGTGYQVSQVYPRASDGRRVVSVLVALRDRAGTNVLGYLGAEILVERLGKRLQNATHISGENTSFQIIDTAGQALFNRDLTAAAPAAAEVDPELLRMYRHDHEGVQERNGTLHIISTLEPTGWIAVMDRPADLLLRPVHDLLRRTLILVSWLVLGTTVAAILMYTFYRRQLLSSLRTEREQIFNEKILANMPIGIALVDPAGERLLHVNGAFTEIVRSLGTLPKNSDAADATFADLAVATRESLARVLHFGVPFQAIEQRTTTTGGQVRFLTTNLLRLQDNQQRTIGVLCLLEDTTGAVTLRQELISANTAKDQFLAQLSHELRNPLSPVITMVAELGTFAETQPALRQPLEIIRRNVELEARLIDDLLDVTRISSGKLQLACEAIDVHRTLALALEICQQEIEEKGLRVELDLRALEHFSLADPARLQQVFWNLLKNAVKFTAAERRITVRSANIVGPTNRGTPPVTLLRIEVIDEGIGIEPQHLRRIFNAFDQGQSSITQRFGGLGLGLAISKAMVEAHGGTLSVNSPGAGKGATFTVDLATCPAPSVAEPPPAIAPSSSPAPANGAVAAPEANGVPSGPRVLLVDDHEDTCVGMQRLLTRRGYRVVVANSVADAMAKARDEGVFDLLISDLGLPDGSGCDLMEALRKSGGPPGIALSGYGMESDITRTREAGFSEHLIKPVAIDRLEQAMQRLLPRGVTHPK